MYVPIIFSTLDSVSSVQFSSSVVSNSLWPHELQHARPPCPSPTPRVHPNPCPLSWWCHSTISSSVVPFSSCPQSFPASGSFPVSQLFSWGGQTPTPHFKSINSLVLNLLHSPTLTPIHDHWKTIAFTRRTFVGKAMSLLFSVLSRLVITFLPRSKHLVDT